MTDFHVRSDSVDVEQIMRQIRTRIREKRGADYTEAELQELAKVKLEKFLDPRGVRSDLIAQFLRHRTVSPEIPKLIPQDIPIYHSHRGILVTIRRLLNPVLKLFVNPNPVIHAIHQLTLEQARINEEFDGRFRQREKLDPLYYEVIHNLVLEMTRLGIEVHNLKMRVESLSSRLDFEERRGRSLERVVEYRPGALQRQAPPPGAPAQAQGAAGAGPRADGVRPESEVGGERRRRRRRRRRRPGQTLADQAGPAGSAGSTGSAGSAGSAGMHSQPGDDSFPDDTDSEPSGGDGPDDDEAPDQ